ncbi:MAG TPA: UDP-3-O-(3-hydroxymyristoyl)glucosamine N-acyltransferase [Planctomycetota bacterium]|nr:UDP-3-O-(3-hydroxymyristoyl)glucosamine N-acyltransferase [Planctomycetota bacterium]
MTLEEISRTLQGELRGPGGIVIDGIASLERAGPGQLAPLGDVRFAAAARASKAGALLVSANVAGPWLHPHIVVGQALVALNRLIEIMGLARLVGRAGTHPTAIVDATADVHPSATVGPYTVIEADARIGARTRIDAHVVMERGAVLGEDCCVAPGAVLHEGLVAGNRVCIGAHAVLSRPGFGYVATPAGPQRLHHIGRVVLEDDVHVGAGTTIDRARFEDTRVGRFSALDNLVHVGHNSTIGARTFIAAQVGLAGHARIGNDCEVGGQAGISVGCGVGDRCRIAGRSGLIRSFGDGKTVLGYPAMEKPEALRMVAVLRRIASRWRDRRKRILPRESAPRRNGS